MGDRVQCRGYSARGRSAGVQGHTAPAGFGGVIYVVQHRYRGGERRAFKEKGFVIKEVSNMMGYNYMFGAYGSGMMFFSWISYVLVIVLLALGIAALWKYINGK